MYALMALLGKPETWQDVKETIADDDLINKLINFSVDDITSDVF